MPVSVDTSPIAADSFDLELVAQLFYDRVVNPAVLIPCFKITTVFAVRPQRPGFMVASLPDMGRWVSVYSTLDHLHEHEGAVRWMSLLGADAMNLLPADVGLILDPHLSHAAAIPPRASMAAGNVPSLNPRQARSDS